MFQHKHPLYAERLPDWTLMGHVFAGERAVKEQSDLYLPPTSAMRANGYNHLTRASNYTPGGAAYEAYKMRAVFHDFVRDAVSGLLGIMHRQAPIVEVPERLAPMVESFSVAGEPLDLVWRRVSQAQLVDGRIGMLVDVPTGLSVADTVPYVALYGAGTITNWDVTARDAGRYALQLVVLDESGNVRQPTMEWLHVKRYRVLAQSDIASAMSGQDLPEGAYVVGVAESESEIPAFFAPQVGSEMLSAIPFVFVNSNDLAPEPDLPPLLGLANLSLAIYRGEADYRQALYLQGQDTLVRVGYVPPLGEDGSSPVQVGAGSVIDLPIGGTASFIGVSATGLGEQRAALENDKAQASQKAVQLLDTSRGGAESGEALRVRVSARTASLASLQQTAAQAFRDCLRYAGAWMGLPDSELDKIRVEPNLDFSDARVDTASVNALMDAVGKGAPLSMESIHKWLAENEYTDLPFLEELEKMGARPVSVSGVPEGEAPSDDAP